MTISALRAIATPRLLRSLLDAAVARDPDHPAVVAGEHRIGYRELGGRVDALAATLTQAGVRGGDAVALVLPNRPGWPAALFAVATAGGVAVPLNPQFKAPELEFCCRDAGVRAIVCDAATAGAAQRLADALPGAVAVVDADAPTGAPIPRAWPERLPDDTALLLYSPGTTGRPKRVARSHRRLVAEARSVVDGLGLSADDRVLCTVPLFHTYGLGCCLLAAMGAGATLVLPDGPEPLMLQRARLFAVLSRARVTVLPTVPYVLRLLARSGGADLPALRLCLSAAIPLPRSTFDAFQIAFGVPVRQLYGTTETGAVSVNLDADPAATVASVGTALPGVEIRVVGADGADLPTGRIGDVLVRTPGMAEGYAGGNPLSRAAFSGGFFRSGDRGRLDEAGRLFLTGRTKRLIDVRGGEKVDPIEVEDVLAVHPRVAEVAVVGVPSDVEGEERVKAVVVSSGPRQEARELIRYCRERLADYKAPAVVAFVDEIPRDANGAVLRKYLVD